MIQISKVPKVCALVPFKNESHNFKTFFQNLDKVVDLVLGFDDNSIDDSKGIFKEFGGILIDYKGESHWGRGGQRLVRNKLLETGRNLGGTHFLILDADEFLSSNYLDNAKNDILNLSPGKALALPWVNLWKSFDQVCGQGTPWAPMLKDFAFADSENTSYPEGLIHFSRTPISAIDGAWIKSNFDGAVIHTQFAQWKRTQLKQAWYRCLELVYTQQKARHVNFTYEITKEKMVNSVVKINKDWIEGITFPSDLEDFELDWHAKEILNWFEEKGPIFFERLDIWHIKPLRDYFEANVGRSPRKPLYPSVFRKQAAVIRGKFA